MLGTASNTPETCGPEQSNALMSDANLVCDTDVMMEILLSHGVGILDCLIAAIAFRLAKPFYTFNLKHFQIIPGLDAQAPYVRIPRGRS